MNVQHDIATTIFHLFIIYTTIELSRSCPVPAPHVADPNQIPDYYWKDYVGVIPEDAIEGGTDELGNPTYIGQVYIKDLELLPAIIYRGCKTATTTAYGEERKTDKNIKILCAKEKNKFEWVATKNEETQLLTNRHFVIGGTEVDQILNIGRVNYGGRLITGKIFSYPLPNRGLAVPYNGKPVVFQSYEILIYNINKSSKIPVVLDIDVRYTK